MYDDGTEDDGGYVGTDEYGVEDRRHEFVARKESDDSEDEQPCRGHEANRLTGHLRKSDEFTAVVVVVVWLWKGRECWCVWACAWE